MKDKVIPILVAVLIFFAFFSGSLWTKVKQLESNPNQKAVPEQQVQEPTEPEVLGVEDQAEITKGVVASKGPEDAKVTIVEFSEYQCPFCKRYIDTAYQQIMENYGEQIRYVFRDYPLPFHQHAQITAVASRCAGEQGQYWPYHDKLFENQEIWSTEQEINPSLTSYATELGLDQAQFSQCLSSGKFDEAIEEDIKLAQKVGVSGTPSFFINGQMLVGAQPFEAFEALIEEELGE